MATVYLTSYSETVGSLLHQRKLLAQGIVDIASKMGILTNDAQPNGAEVLMLIDDILTTLDQKEEDSDHESQ